MPRSKPTQLISVWPWLKFPFSKPEEQLSLSEWPPAHPSHPSSLEAIPQKPAVVSEKMKGVNRIHNACNLEKQQDSFFVLGFQVEHVVTMTGGRVIISIPAG